MKTIHIIGGRPLYGSIEIQSAKNACLPILAACVLTDGKSVIRNVPKISDIGNLLHILSGLGVRCEWSGGGVYIDTTNIVYNEINRLDYGASEGF